MKALVALILSVTLCAPAVAAWSDGNKLAEEAAVFQRWLRDSQTLNAKENFEVDYFMGYVDGVVGSMEHFVFCVPNGASLKQVAAIVADYTMAHPKLWDKEGSEIVARALKETYPCPAH